jgi:hypothetical protein
MGVFGGNHHTRGVTSITPTLFTNTPSFLGIQKHHQNTENKLCQSLEINFGFSLGYLYFLGVNMLILHGENLRILNFVWR